MVVTVCHKCMYHRRIECILTKAGTAWPDRACRMHVPPPSAGCAIKARAQGPAHTPQQPRSLEAGCICLQLHMCIIHIMCMLIYICMMQGYFNGFGGKVEANETIEQAAHREVGGLVLVDA